MLIGVAPDGSCPGTTADGEALARRHRIVASVHDGGRYELTALPVGDRTVVAISVARRRQGFAQTTDGQVVVRRDAMNVTLLGFRLAEDAGRGVDLMQDAMAAQLLDPPVFAADEGSVTVDLPLTSTVTGAERAWAAEIENRLRPRDRVLLVHAARGETLTNGSARGGTSGRGPACPVRFVLDEGMPLDGEYEISPVGWVRDQTEKIFETGTTASVDIKGRAVVLLTTRGARTGTLRKVPLMRVEHDGEYAIVASLGGAPKHPVWFHNVKAEPHVELQDGTETRDYRAREVTGEEKALWWDRAVAAFPDYAAYQRKTEREIPVFVLSP